ncbi:MAG: polysaccharide deacetylase family protein [Desulfobacteraceae bacterium]|nr:polysaccharide deacetylase family protein [Desulfobacteraceae bacterium]
MNRLFFFILPLICIVLMAGCTGHLLPVSNTAQCTRNDYLAIVTIQPQDTLESLARTYLGSEEKAWWIADYNHIQKAEAGQKVVIPLKPLKAGGLQLDGYQTLPVLLFSKITTGAAGAQAISANQFEGQMQFLRDNGYRTVSLNMFYGFLNLEEQLPQKTVIITLDSTQRWVYETAYPILKRQGFTAAVFVSTGRVGKPGAMTWQELSTLSTDGFEIGAAGVSAQKLTLNASNSDPAEYLQNLENEISSSRATIEDHLKTQCFYFAYPGGEMNDLITAMVKQSGYKAAFTRQGGSNPFFVNNYKVHRIVITNSNDAAQMRQNLITQVPAELR